MTGFKWLPSIAYPPSQAGYWNPITSTLNWCEEDYYATVYSAEIVNTLTNLMFIYLAGKGISNCVQNGHDSIFIVSFFGYLIVGLGSMMFHSTLKYPMQLVDELSMIYTTCLMFWATFSHGRSMQYGISLGSSLLLLSVGITGYYHFLQDPVFHQIVYGCLTAIVLFRSIYVMEFSIRPSLKEKVEHAQHGDNNKHANGSAHIRTEAECKRRDERDIKILNTMWTMIAFGLSTFLGGFFVWNLDNMFCSSLRTWRREIGLPWGVVLEGHGWWHIMTGVGAYYYLTWGIWLRHCLNGRQDEFEMIWPAFWTSFPVVVKRKRVEMNGSAADGRKER